MPTLSFRITHHGLRSHQKNWGAAFTQGWRKWRLRWARHCQRSALGDLADDPHLLADIGVTREQALQEAGKSFFDLADLYIHSQ